MEPRSSSRPLPPFEDLATRGDGYGYAPPKRAKERVWLHVLLFALTLASTMFAGALMAGRIELYEAAPALFADPVFGVGWSRPLLLDGLRYAVAMLGFLTVHEFGHYFAARHHRIDTSLPYYIPLPISLIGTLGAVIRIREPLRRTRHLFDVGAAGPLAGFVVAVGLLVYALATLPGPEYILTQGGHEAIKAYVTEHGRYPSRMLTDPADTDAIVIVLGQTPLYWLATQFVEGVPPMYEVMHYPVLVGAWFALFFTALNLLPIGQLDGGHIVYSLVGPKWHGRIARGFMVMLLGSGALGFERDVAPWLYDQHPLLGPTRWILLALVLYFFLRRVFDGEHRYIAPTLTGLLGLAFTGALVGPPLLQFGYAAWFIWSLLLIFLVKIDHPPVLRQEPLTPGRRALGMLAMVIFVLCFSLNPVYTL